jgi:hypothetical protein
VDPLPHQEVLQESIDRVREARARVAQEDGVVVLEREVEPGSERGAAPPVLQRLAELLRGQRGPPIRRTRPLVCGTVNQWAQSPSHGLNGSGIYTHTLGLFKDSSLDPKPLELRSTALSPHCSLPTLRRLLARDPGPEPPSGVHATPSTPTRASWNQNDTPAWVNDVDVSQLPAPWLEPGAPPSKARRPDCAEGLGVRTQRERIGGWLHL